MYVAHFLGSLSCLPTACAAQAGPPPVLTTLVCFTADATGSRPGSTLVADNAGNLFGATFSGGVGGGYGTVFRLFGPGHQALTTLATFTGGLDGDIPQAGLVADAAGNLYGTTTSGGAGGDSETGTVFVLTRSGFVTSTATTSTRK